MSFQIHGMIDRTVELASRTKTFAFDSQNSGRQGQKVDFLKPNGARSMVYTVWSVTLQRTWIAIEPNRTLVYV